MNPDKLSSSYDSNLFSLNFLIQNMMNTPLSNVYESTKLFFDYMYEQIKSYEQKFIIFFIFQTIFIVLYFLMLIYFSFKQINEKSQTANLLISLDPIDIETTRDRISEFQRLMPSPGKKNHGARDSPRSKKTQYKSSLSPILERGLTLKKRQKNISAYNKNGRRFKIANYKNFSINFSFIIMICVIVSVILYSFVISNRENVKDYFVVSEILVERMKIIFERNALHNMLGVSLVGMFTSKDFKINNSPAEPIFLEALDEFRKFESIYSVFLNTRYDSKRDQTFEKVNQVNFCKLFAETSCHDAEIMGHGWIHFEGAYADIIQRVYTLYQTSKDDSQRLKEAYNSIEFLNMETTLLR